MRLLRSVVIDMKLKCGEFMGIYDIIMRTHVKSENANTLGVCVCLCICVIYVGGCVCVCWW